MSLSSRIFIYGAACLLGAALQTGAGFAAPSPVAKPAETKAAAKAAPAAAKTAPADDNAPDGAGMLPKSAAAQAEYTRDCIFGIEALELRLMRQYPNFTPSFISGYPDLIDLTTVACVKHTAVLVMQSGKKVNLPNIRSYIGDQLRLRDTLPETIKGLESFRELMIDSQ